MNLSKGRIWPYAIGASIILVFGACVATIVVTNTLPVQNSDTYMMNYHEADEKANDIIKAAIEFNSNYKIEYISDKLDLQNSVIKYKVSDLNANPINNAEIKVVVTRPNNHKYDQELSNPKVQNGIYTFESLKLAQEGRWDIMSKVTVNEFHRFYNVKADTRTKEITEY
ncbi:FixH family protein [Sulfurimonas sp.]|uniref:FixH family protein n=1 Tax=Sulfurimonas sp. TaxID=2022749 RepID=UPI0025DB7FAC|nr:FixH family protein [Sulfurimonas sp.]MCK9472616.1 FixH family protein [Sulfurimonas sp.]MDD3505081.1 FixH family protein [Sulfurimonas sp.]